MNKLTIAALAVLIPLAPAPAVAEAGSCGWLTSQIECDQQEAAHQAKIASLTKRNMEARELLATIVEHSCAYDQSCVDKDVAYLMDQCGGKVGTRLELLKCIKPFFVPKASAEVAVTTKTEINPERAAPPKTESVEEPAASAPGASAAEGWSAKELAQGYRIAR